MLQVHFCLVSKAGLRLEPIMSGESGITEVLDLSHQWGNIFKEEGESICFSFCHKLLLTVN